MIKKTSQRKILPGQYGTIKYQKKYGDKLVCVRYKYDINKKEKIKTVELIVSRDYWNPDSTKISPNKIVGLRIRYGEIELARRVKSLGGKWNRQKKVWEIPYRYSKILRLENRIVK